MFLDTRNPRSSKWRWATASLAPSTHTPHAVREITEEMVTCECGELPQTVEHILLECPKHLMMHARPRLSHGYSHTRCAQLVSSDSSKRHGRAQLPELCGSPDELPQYPARLESLGWAGPHCPDPTGPTP